MTYPGLEPRLRPIATACFRSVRRRRAYARQREQALPPRRTFRATISSRTVERIRRETKLQLQGMRRLLHALFG